MNVAAAKRSLRRRLGAERSRLMPGIAESTAARIREHLETEAAWVTAPQLALYAALADEIPTRSIFEALARAGRACLFPRMLAGGRLEFAPVERWRDLVPGRFGVHEPRGGVAAATLCVDDVVLVPGVAFDPKGLRLGRGGGYYDRSFPAEAASQPRLIGLACEFQIVESVPHDSHDRPMDAIVTERAFRWTRGDGR